MLVTGLLLTAIWTLGEASPARRVEPKSILIFDVAQNAFEAPARQPSKLISSARTLPLQVIPEPQPTQMPPVSATVDPSVAAQQNPSGSIGADCDLTGPIQAALQESQAVRAALTLVPAGQRSAANAVMLWDGTWTDVGNLLSASVTEAVDDVLTDPASTARDCRHFVQTGPRLFYLSESGATTVLALGSGQWRWQDVLDTTELPGRGNPAALAQTGLGLPLAAQPLPAARREVFEDRR